MAKTHAANGKQKGTRQSRFMPIFLSLVFVATLVISLPSIILSAIALLPTAVAFIVDRTKAKYNTITVGAMNFAGLWPYLWQLWTEDHTIPAALALLNDPFVWLVIYSAAAFGWGLFMLVPPVMVQVIDVFEEKRVQILRKNQHKIIEEWGQEVSDTGFSPHN